jgi:acetoin utilization protein AcuC
VFPGMHQASALVTGATLAAARAVWSGTAQHGAAIAGGMHHAMSAHASGFGVYNDVTVAVRWLLEGAPSASPRWTLTRTTATGAGRVL